MVNIIQTINYIESYEHANIISNLISDVSLQVLTFIMKNMKFIRQKVMQKEGGIVKNE